MTRTFLSFSILLIFFSCNSSNSKDELLLVKKLDYYPSASGIEYFNNHFYIIGDDARYLLVLDNSFNPVDSFVFYTGTEKRLAKDTKADHESITTLSGTDGTILFTRGSGSLIPFRNKAWWFDPLTRKGDSLRLDSFFIDLGKAGIKEINIEGETNITGFNVLSNRGNKGNPVNHIVFIDDKYENGNRDSTIHIAECKDDSDTSSFKGISGLDYDEKNDRLIMSVSTEDTRNSYEDGAIGKSYLWIVNGITAKVRSTKLIVDYIIDLEKIDTRFKGQKIESVCVMRENNGKYALGLVADNDDGSSTLFIVIIHMKG